MLRVAMNFRTEPGRSRRGHPGDLAGRPLRNRPLRRSLLLQDLDFSRSQQPCAHACPARESSHPVFCAFAARGLRAGNHAPPRRSTCAAGARVRGRDPDRTRSLASGARPWRMR
jgi:hypothetical protein